MSRWALAIISCLALLRAMKYCTAPNTSMMMAAVTMSVIEYVLTLFIFLVIIISLPLYRLPGTCTSSWQWGQRHACQHPK
jgi:amino acid permease